MDESILKKRTNASEVHLIYEVKSVSNKDIHFLPLWMKFESNPIVLQILR